MILYQHIMGFKRFKILLVAAGLLFAVQSVCAAPVVKAKLDSVNLLMGRSTILQLSVSQPKGVKGAFPLLSKFRQDGIIPLCGDSVELRAPSRIDTMESAAGLDIIYQVPLQAFDSGYYRLPEFVYVFGNDSVKSNQVSFKVYPVPAEASTPIYDYAGVADPLNPSIFDWLPDWVVDFWWVILIVLAALVVYLYALRRYRSQGYIIPKKPEPTPYQAAISGLALLKEKKLWEKGMEKEYFTELTDILRVYLYRRFGINAVEMTSREIMDSLGQNQELKDKRQYFRQILDMADFVKFAKVRPLPDDNVLAFDNARRFVEETKPVPAVEDDKKEATAGVDSVKDKEVQKGGKP